MAWSWSHTQEAYDNACLNLALLDKSELDIIYGEWQAHIDESSSLVTGFDEKCYYIGLDIAKHTDVNILLDKIWTKVKAFATCDNGGFKAWVCPYGCHTVSFDKE